MTSTHAPMALMVVLNATWNGVKSRHWRRNKIDPLIAMERMCSVDAETVLHKVITSVQASLTTQGQR